MTRSENQNLFYDTRTSAYLKPSSYCQETLGNQSISSPESKLLELAGKYTLSSPEPSTCSKIASDLQFDLP